MSLGHELAKRYRKVSIKCGKCGRKLLLSGKRDLSGKRHAHCTNCKLEWHLTPEGRFYSHSISF